MAGSPALLRLLDSIARAMAKADQRSIQEQAILLDPIREASASPMTFHVKAPESSPTAKGPGSGPPES